VVLPRGLGWEMGWEMGWRNGYIEEKNELMSRVYICDVIPDRVDDPEYPEDRIFREHSPTLVEDGIHLIVGTKGASEGGALVFRRSDGNVWPSVLLGRVPVITRSFVSVGFNEGWSLSVSFSESPIKDGRYDEITTPFFGAWPDLDEIFIWSGRIPVQQRGHYSQFFVGGRAEYEESVRQREARWGDN